MNTNYLLMAIFAMLTSINAALWAILILLWRRH